MLTCIHICWVPSALAALGWVGVSYQLAPQCGNGCFGLSSLQVLLGLLSASPTPSIGLNAVPSPAPIAQAGHTESGLMTERMGPQ